MTFEIHKESNLPENNQLPCSPYSLLKQKLYLSSLLFLLLHTYSAVTEYMDSVFSGGG